MMPADSASVRFAADVPIDTLRRVWTAQPPETAPFGLPTSIGWAHPDSSKAALAVVDTKEARVHFFSQDGRHSGSWDIGDAESFPYLAGILGDTVTVLNRGRDEIAWWLEGGLVRRIDVPEGSEAAVVTSSFVATRAGGGQDGPGSLNLHPRNGVAPWKEHPMEGDAWRSLGFLRVWGDSVLALSGFRPVVDVLPPGRPDSAPLDTIALFGFASPKLVQSWQFMQGDTDQPPLLTSSARPLGDALYVLNMRGDHVRMDKYDRSGTLQRVYVSPGPWDVLDAFPADLAIRASGGRIEVAVLMQRPGGLLRRADAWVTLFRLPE